MGLARQNEERDMTLTMLDNAGNYREIDTATASADDGEKYFSGGG